MATKDISDVQVIEATAKFNIDRTQRITDRLMSETSQCEKVCYSALERADKRGLIEWGVSIGSAWLTEKGELMLEQTMPGLYFEYLSRFV